MAETELIRISTRLTEEQKFAFTRLRIKTGLTQAELIRVALAEYAALHREDSSVWHDTPQHGGKRE